MSFENELSAADTIVSAFIQKNIDRRLSNKTKVYMRKQKIRSRDVWLLIPLDLLSAQNKKKEFFLNLMNLIIIEMMYL